MRNNKEYKLKLSLKKTFMLLSMYIDYLFKKNEKGRKMSCRYSAYNV